MVSNFFNTIKEEGGFLGLNNRDWVHLKKHLIFLGFSAAVSIYLIKFQMKLMKNFTSTSNSQEIKKKLLAHFRSLNTKNKIPEGRYYKHGGTYYRNVPSYDYKMPYKFNKYELDLCEKVIFNTDCADQNKISDEKSLENGFTEIGGLEK